MTNVAYVFLLLVFVALGMFVYALAAESALAGIIGASLVVLMVASVAGFRVGARKRAESNDSGIEIPGETSGLGRCAANRSSGICRPTAVFGTTMSNCCRRSPSPAAMRRDGSIGERPDCCCGSPCVPAVRAGPLLVGDAAAAEVLPRLDVRGGGQAWLRRRPAPSFGRRAESCRLGACHRPVRREPPEHHGHNLQDRLLPDDPKKSPRRGQFPPMIPPRSSRSSISLTSPRGHALAWPKNTQMPRYAPTGPPDADKLPHESPEGSRQARRVDS